MNFDSVRNPSHLFQTLSIACPPLCYLGHVYDEIQEPPRSLHTGAAGTKAADAVYANAQLPTILSDDTTYSIVQLPKMHPGDST